MFSFVYFDPEGVNSQQFHVDNETFHFDALISDISISRFCTFNYTFTRNIQLFEISDVVL